jgi:hypothetical protein
MENKLENLEKFITNEMCANGEYKIINLKETFLCVFKNGEVYRWYDSNRGRLIKNPKFKLIPNVENNGKGYNDIWINGKLIRRHRVICYTFKNLDIDNEKLHIDHIDGNRINNNINNLRIVTPHQNHFNVTTAKGYCYNKTRNKWRAIIALNGKQHYLGLYTTKEDARSAYLAAKLIYHKIEVEHIEQELNYEDLEREFEAIVCN